jgi:hypothetical protein
MATNHPTEATAPAKVPADELFESITGFDEIAISKAFGLEIHQVQEKPFMFMRALVFVNERRRGANDLTAHSTAMNMTMAALTDYFAEPEEELDPNDPDTESGKGDSPLV